MNPEATKLAMKIHKSDLKAETKEIMLFIVAQLIAIDNINEAKLIANKKKGSTERLKEWHDNGSIYCEMTIKDGKRHGTCSVWSPEGVSLCEIPFENGVIHGVAHIYKSAGQEDIYFKEGCPILLDSLVS